jgi:photosystem II stability/assembly factor-like uncharacterized protein
MRISLNDFSLGYRKDLQPNLKIGLHQPLLVGIVFFFLLLISSNVNGQKFLEIAEKSKSKDFKKIVKEAEQYYEKMEKKREKEEEGEEEGEEYNLFKRWEYFNSSRLTSAGKIQNIAAKNFEEFNIHENQRRAMRTAAATTSGNWTSLGPTSRTKTPGGYSSGIGRVNCIMVDPANSNIIYIGAPSGGIWRSTTGGNSWSPLSDGLTAIGVSGIAIDPTSSTSSRTIYILTGDGDGGATNSIGVLKSTDGGSTWLSTGLSWSVSSYVRGFKLSIHPTNPLILFAVTNSGVYKTSDGASTWTQVLSGSYADLEFQPGNPSTLYVGSTSGSVYKSTNTGTNWSILSPGGSSGRIALAVTPANSNYLYVLYGGVPSAGTYNGLYRSTDAGVTFSLRSNTPNIYDGSTTGSGSGDQSWYDHGFTASPTNAEELHAGGVNCWKSTNGGTTFTSTSNWVETSAGPGHYTHADIHDLVFFGSTLYCGSDGGIFKSTDNAATWQDISVGLAITEMYRIGVDRLNPLRICYGAQDNGLNSLQSNLATQWMGADGFETCIDYTNSNIIYGMTQYGGFQRTDDNGQTRVGITPSSATGGAWLTPFVMDPNNPQTLYAGYTDVFKTTNKGAAWSNITNSLIGGGSCNHIAIAPSNTNYLYVSKGSTLYKTTNGGTSWATISSGLPGQTITYFAIHPNDPNSIWVTLGGYSSGQKVYQSTDGGTSWTNISGSLPNLPANCIVATGNNSGLYIGMDVGVYYRDNSLGSWINFNNGLPNVIIDELEINPTSFQLMAGSYGRGVWQSDLYAPCSASYALSGPESGIQTFIASSTISSTAQIGGVSDIEYIAANMVTLSDGFKADGIFRAAIGPCSGTLKTTDMNGIYGGQMSGTNGSSLSNTETDSESIIAIPNPFSLTTTIQFVIKEDMPITLIITDMMGNEMATLIKDEPYSAGTYSIPFSANNLKYGMYVCILKTKDKNEVTKIIISK